MIMLKFTKKQGFQWCSKDTSSVTFEVLNNQLKNRFYKFINLQLFHVKYNFVHFKLFNVQYKFVQFQLFDVKFLFFAKHIFFKKKRTAFMDTRPQFWVLNSPRKTMTCYLRGTNKFLRYCNLCMSILKWGFPTKGIELTSLVLFEVPEMPQI